MTWVAWHNGLRMLSPRELTVPGRQPRPSVWYGEVRSETTQLNYNSLLPKMTCGSAPSVRGSGMQGAGRLTGVESLRGVAALLVVAVHTRGVLSMQGPAAFGDFWVFGRAGVDFFFVLSGFIIAFVHFKDLGKPDALGSFWIKRLLRIYPAYWIVLAGFLALLLVSPTPGRSERDLAHVACSFLLCPEQAEPVLGVGWSLRHELLFYAVFSTAIISRRLGTVMFAAWGAGIAWNAGVYATTGVAWFSGALGTIVFRGFNMAFFFGMAVAVLTSKGWTWRPGLVAVLGGAGFLATGMYESYGPVVMQEWPIRTLAYAVSAAAILYGTATLDRARSIRVPAFAMQLGTSSYSIYLVHVPVLLLLEYVTRGVRSHIPPEVSFVVLGTCAVGAGVIFSLLVEQPLGRAGRRLRYRVSQPA